MQPPARALPRLVSAARMRHRDVHQGRRRFVRSRLRLSQPSDRHRRARRRSAPLSARSRRAHCDEQDRYSYQRERRSSSTSIRANVLNIQHEYGLFGGERGEWLIDLIRAVEKPVVVTLHTVLPDPDETMLRVTRALCAHASKVVVALGDRAAVCSKRVYGIDPERLRVIHHGVPDVPFQRHRRGKGRVRHRPAPGDLDVRLDQSRQGPRVRDRSDARRRQAPSRSAVPDSRRDASGRAPPRRRVVSRIAAGDGARAAACNYNVQLVDKYLDFDELVELSRRDRHLPHAVPQPGADRQRHARVRRRLRQGDRLDAVSLRAGTARAQPRLPVRVPRCGLDRARTSTCCSTIRRCAARPSAARIASAGR